MAKIEYIQASKSSEVKKILHPLVAEWFFRRFEDFSLTQLYGVNQINGRNNILISAPTGGTKTLTAFLSILNYLVGLALKNELEEKIYAVYTSPLKALTNDIFVNLVRPLEEIKELAEEKGLKMQEIRVGLRTGDTTVSERAKMARKVPHIFVTTPESLAIILTTKKFVDNLRALEFIIVDEIHALANKRGVYLSLTLERLQEVSSIEPVRIGLSATIAPIEEIAKFLVGNDRECGIAKVELNKKIDIGLLSPGKDLLEIDNLANQKELYRVLNELIQNHKTTLIFTNTRAATERIIHYLDLHFPGKYNDLIGAHHSAMSKENRFEIEDKLRKGELKVVVSSTSLELGIDIGDIDLVVLLRSPKGVARALQRCLPYSSKILCADGLYREIGDIVENNLPVDLVSYDEKGGFVKNKIAIRHRNRSQDMIKINLECGEEIACTPEHPLLTKTGWKRAKEIRLDEYVSEIRHKINFDVNEPYIYELLPKDKVFVQNKDNFFQKITDNYRKEKGLNVKQFSVEFGMPYSRLIDCRRLSGRKKSVRLDFFLKACELCGMPKKDYLPHLTRLKNKGTKWPIWPLKLTEEMVWLAGVIATDGYLQRSQKKGEPHYYKVRIGNKSKTLINKVKKIAEKYSAKPYINLRKDGVYEIEFGAGILSYVFNSLGIPFKNKTYNIFISDWLFSLPDNLIHSYLEGVFEGDGNLNTTNNHGMIRIFTASKKFSEGLHLLFSRLGYNNKVKKNKIKTSKLVKKVSGKNIYHVALYRKEDLRRFFQSTPCYGEKAQRGRVVTANWRPYLTLKKDYNKFESYVRVVSIKKESNKEPVYNLTLDNKLNNFIVGNVIVHNCGRAGHRLHSNPKGRFVVMDRDDLIECSILMKQMIEKKIDRVDIPKNALDVLAQQIYGMAITKIWKIDEMLEVIRRSYCYGDLSKEDFLSVISYLSGEFDLEHRHVYAKIWYNVETGEIGKRGMMARVLYLTNIGTIPEEGFVSIVIQSPKEKKGQIVGKIDEGFLERLKKGDVFVLGGQKYQFIHSKGMKAYVIGDVSRNPTIPSWFSEMLPLSFDVAFEIAKFRGFVKERLKNREDCMEFIKDYLYCSDEVAVQVYDYFSEQGKFSEIPDDKTIVIERFKQDKEYLMFHSMYGRRVNDALSRAYGYAAAKFRGRDVELGINDNGFFIAGERLDVRKIIEYVNSKNFEGILKEAIEKTDVLRRRFRHCASRSLMILRNYKGRSKSVGKQQVHSHFLLAAVKKISNEFPILKEARREVLEDLMDIDSAKKILKDLEVGKVNFKIVNLPLVSPFGLNLIMQSHADLIRMEDKAVFLKRMHELQMKIIGGV
ncbi:MAG: DEAD/DEAH box helicase [Candidatus Pacearchaeota archaeon]|nr:DEAD/DEAH box helicase [Candidatus Pacearchaeota archaeon]